MLTKRILRALTTESAVGNPSTYEKGLFDPEKNNHLFQNESSGLSSYCRSCNFCEMGYPTVLRLNTGEHKAI